MGEIKSYVLQYVNVDANTILNLKPDLFITEGGPLTSFETSQVTAEELAALKAAGVTVVAYVNMCITDDNRPYWNKEWTEDGKDSGKTTEAAPKWLKDKPSNSFGYVVDYTDPEWRKIVIDQAVDLLKNGFDGVFLDDLAQYYIAGATGKDIPGQAMAMMEFALEINAAVKAVNPSAILISNGNPYVVTDCEGGPTTPTANAFLTNLDAMLLESFYGISGTQDEARMHCLACIKNRAQVLALEYGGTAEQHRAFVEKAKEDGVVPFAAPDDSYSGIAPLWLEGGAV
mmetsp:Transcript_10749/g.18977  ORF Transcript_10749/g.18977 Transcript_10749/m.18977 type:complete len:286 (-) Transcript_10749:71-928(-)